MSELALKLIREAKKTKAKKLDLGKCGLTELPDELFELVWLEELYLSNSSWLYDFETKELIKFGSENEGFNNNIKIISTQIQNLKQLKVLLINGYLGDAWDLKDLSPLKDLKKIQVLMVSETSVSDLSPLKNFKMLNVLNVSKSQVRDLTPLIKINKLQYLNVSKSLVSDLSPLKNFINLLELHARFLRINNVFFVEKLEKLKILGLGSNGISNIDHLKNCKELKYVYLWDNPIHDLSPLKSLENLEVLYVRQTQVSSLHHLKNLKKLYELSVSTTNISDLTPLEKLEKLVNLRFCHTKVGDLRPLKKLIENRIPVKWSEFGNGINVEGCPLINPPIEIAKQGNEAILNYWKQIEEQGGVETINEAKLIIVGEGGTGKTTLFNKLVDPEFDLNQTSTEETQGINIHEGLEIKDGFRANLWDFGGQELQYMTHQFFLTPNAVYVLMMAARGEAPNLAYWFKIISLLGKDKSGGKISLIIVLNKKQGSTGMPQYQDLLKVYEDDFDSQFIELDLAENDSRWESLRESIVQRLTNLPIVKNPLPKKWNPIRESLRITAQKKPYIDAARLDVICGPHEVKQEADQFLMTNYLHELGSLLHFQGDEDDLLDLIVLSPEWVVEGVYTVLKNDRIKKELNGKFSKKDMIDILCKNQYELGGKKKKYTRVDAQKMIQLMSKNNFDICYKSESGKYVAAQLLPTNRPSNLTWNKNHTTTLQFRYQYPIMPKGLMSRLIVRLSDNIEVVDKQEMVWKKGAILRMDINGSDCRVLMREDDGESRTGLRQIIIEVLESDPLFANRKYALQRVRDEIDSLHKRWFKNITFEQIVPCNCIECKDSDTPYTYELAKLVKLKKGRAYCNTQEEFVPLRQLLEGVYEPKEIQSFAPNQTMNWID